MDVLDRLLDEHQMLLETVQNSPVHFCVYDSEDRLVAWNQAYEANYPTAFSALREQVARREVTYGDLIRHELSPTLTPEEVEAEVEHRIALQAKAQGEAVVRDYGCHTLRVHKYRLPSGAVAGLAVDISDLAERERELSKARRAAEQSESAKARFLANMSHEIRTPMNGIMGLTELLAETSLNADQHNLVRTIMTSAEALLSTINEVLDFSKIDAGKLEIVTEIFDLRRLANEVVDLLRPVADQKSIALKCFVPLSARPHFIGDVVRIRQCLLNLLGNAIKFTTKGAVTLSITRDTDHQIRIEVVDTGIGIAPEYINSIFSAFEQADTRTARQFEGTGLGLAITRRLVELMGGRIAVASELGVGTTFTMRLPLEQAEPIADIVPSTPAPISAAGLEGLRVLLAEDNRTNQLVVTKMLNGTVGDIVIACNGLQAVDLWRAEAPDVILMDVSMPVLSGMDATRQIRKAECADGGQRVPIIALTANAMAEDKVACLDAGMDAFLSKPLRKADLLRTLTETLAL